MNDFSSLDIEHKRQLPIAYKLQDELANSLSKILGIDKEEVLYQIGRVAVLEIKNMSDLDIISGTEDLEKVIKKLIDLLST